MMQFKLFYTDFRKMTLPVNPSQFRINEGQNIKTSEVVKRGEINQIGNEKLRTIEITSFFPKNYSGYCNYKDFKEPYEYVRIIKEWQSYKEPIRLVITTTPINMVVAIQNFSYSEVGGSGNIEYTLSLVEYKCLKVKSLAEDVKAHLSDRTELIMPPSKTNRTETKKIPNSYTTKPGDTIASISKKLTGTFSNAKIIYENNKDKIEFVGITDTFKIQPGTVIIINPKAVKRYDTLNANHTTL
ncbi:LysM peptidoglycan-binding domain-containing protein [Fusibacter ferrireducens]|uniref:LysM peptidoglycan-binding domain-containing protein n=1 Tax=Fusibacter ferrireducens TaxID=2785058 RepID=A0ABR9ZVH0_9FIRM|nr:LysM peptidoglycan-binding domain-containing protein [Fusibacter ferrireducens]MBF4693900.1 LysM peptidoglycan-binding domain-containing protein [Fusibacter ferrireducens]